MQGSQAFHLVQADEATETFIRVSKELDKNTEGLYLKKLVLQMKCCRKRKNLRSFTPIEKYSSLGYVTSFARNHLIVLQ